MKQRINLYRYLPKPPKNLLPLKMIFNYWLAFCLILVIPSIYIIWFYNDQKSTLDFLRQQQQRLVNDYVQLKQKNPDQTGQEQIEQNNQKPDISQKRISELKQQTSLYYSSYFTALAELTPERVWLNYVEISKGASIIRLEGKAVNYDDVTRFITQLSKSEAFAAKAFETLSISQDKQGHVKFVLKSQ